LDIFLRSQWYCRMTELDEFPMFNEKVNFKIQSGDGVSWSAPMQNARSALHLGPKVKKVYHYQSISLMLQQGYKLVNISRGFRYRHEAIMKDFAEKYTKLRFAVKTKLYQGMMKLIVNVISRKCVAVCGIDKNINSLSIQTCKNHVSVSDSFPSPYFSNL